MTLPSVLIVEDEWLVAEDLRDTLEEMGFDTIHCAHDLAAAEIVIARTRLGLAVLDVNIGPDLVFPIAEILRRRNVPIVFSSGRSKTEFPSAWSGEILVPKPLARMALADALRDLGFHIRPGHASARAGQPAPLG
jgi:CheY-like chemotaxis protein